MTGENLCNIKTNTLILLPPASLGDGRCCIVSVSGEVYVIEMDTGIRAHTQVSGTVLSIMSDQNSNILLTSTDGWLQAFDPDLTVLSKLGIKGRISSSPAVTDQGILGIVVAEGILYWLASPC